MIVRRLTFSIFAALTLGACAHVPPTEVEATALPTQTAGTYRPHTLDEYPDFTPAELGRRMLKLIDSLTSFDELSLARVQEVMRMPMHETDPNRYGFGMHLPASDWYCYISYSDTPCIRNPRSSAINSLTRMRPQT